MQEGTETVSDLITIAGKLLEHGVLAASFVGLLYWFLRIYGKDQREFLTRLSDAIHSLSLLVTALQLQLLSHDAQVRGINPTAGDSQEERDNLALREYKRITDLLEQIRSDIESIKEEAR